MIYVNKEDKHTRRAVSLMNIMYSHIPTLKIICMWNSTAPITNANNGENITRTVVK